MLMFWKMEAKHAMEGKGTPAISGQIMRDLSKEVTFELRQGPSSIVKGTQEHRVGPEGAGPGVQGFLLL